MLQTELILRLGFFFSILVTMVIWELIHPRRILKIRRRFRWFPNLSLVVLDSLAARLMVPFTAVSVAIYAEENAIGVLHYFSIPYFIAIPLSLIVFDLLIYLQHIVFHYVPLFWQFHKIHHIDQEFDVTTGVRFHPVEIIASLLIKCAAVVALGAPPVSVILFEVILNGTSLFNHGNIRLSEKRDKWLRLIVVTPDMHRVHHSVIMRETNSNFGFNLPWWDKLFGTYRAQPEKGHTEMEIGLAEYRNVKRTGLLSLLKIPFTNYTFRRKRTRSF